MILLPLFCGLFSYDLVVLYAVVFCLLFVILCGFGGVVLFWVVQVCFVWFGC